METLFTPTLDDALARAGMRLNGAAPQPGRFVRFPTSEKQGDKAGWCLQFKDGEGAAFGDWRAGYSYVWQRRDTDAPPPTEAERAAARAKAETARREADDERRRRQSKAAASALEIWEQCSRVQSHPYLERKGIRAHGARVDSLGRVVLPVLDRERRFQSLQYIGIDGDKRFLTGSTTAGGRLHLGSVEEDAPLVLAEGFATAASIREATGYPCVVAYSCHALKDVATELGEAYPRTRVIVAGDLDALGQGRTHAEAARAACRGAISVYPQFSDGRTVGDWNDLHQAEGAEEVSRQIAAALTAAVAPPSRFKLLTSSDLAATPVMRWRVKGILPESGVVAMFGPSRSGKSFLVMDLAQAIAEGREWFGYRTTQAKVTYCALEGGAGIASRVAAFRKARGGDSANVTYLAQSFNLLDANERRDLVAAIRAAGGAGGVVILDTLARAAPNTDENDSKSMGAVIAAATDLQAELDGLVILIHHTGKDSTRGLRGHSSLDAALDGAIEVSREMDNREWRLHKVKEGEDGTSHGFDLETVEIGHDEEGEPVTSCVVRERLSSEESGRRMSLPKAGNQRIVWDALGEPLRNATEFGQGGAPPLRPCITLEAAIDHCQGKLVCEPKRQRERVKAAIQGLVSRGHLAHQDGWIWCP